jgi:hypothetical protein
VKKKGRGKDSLCWGHGGGGRLLRALCPMAVIQEQTQPGHAKGVLHLLLLMKVLYTGLSISPGGGSWLSRGCACASGG